MTFRLENPGPVRSHLGFDAVVIGGGFYGASVAIYLARQRHMSRVLLVEREACLLSRASFNNQARVHNGYHYPRSFTTAYRSRINLPRFVKDHPAAVCKTFTKLYAIARNHSKVTARQFERFCKDIGAKLESASTEHQSLFEPRLIEKVFKVEEFAFNAAVLAREAAEELAEWGVAVQLESEVKEVWLEKPGTLRVDYLHQGREAVSVTAPWVFNCGYSGLNQLKGGFTGLQAGLKQEITEMALMQMPEELLDLGITVMDGPFFSLMPFPARGLHTLSHVRYTPHQQWLDVRGEDPYAKLAAYDRTTRVDRMLRDVARYVPVASKSRYCESLFEVKTVLVKNENDDGRPILFEKHMALPGCYSILGGKVDNIYDVLDRLDVEKFEQTS